jgi:hypothetical protein
MIDFLEVVLNRVSDMQLFISINIKLKVLIRIVYHLAHFVNLRHFGFLLVVVLSINFTSVKQHISCQSLVLDYKLCAEYSLFIF